MCCLFEDIQLRWFCPLQRVEKHSTVIAVADGGAGGFQVLANRFCGDFRIVVLLREVAKEDVSKTVVVIAFEQFSACVVTLVSAVGEDAFFEESRVGTVEQHLFVVVGFDDEMVGRSDSGFDVVVRHAAVRNEHETFTHEIDDVSEAVGRVVRNTERVDLHAEEFEGFAFFEETASSAEFHRNAVVAVDACVDVGCGINGQVDVLAETPDRADVVCVVVSNEDAHDVGEVQAHVFQAVVDITRRDAGIDEDALFFGPEIVAIAAASRAETAKYEVLLCHFLSAFYAILHKTACKVTTFF